MADACQGEGSSPSVPSSLRARLRKYDSEFSRHNNIAAMWWCLGWSTTTSKAMYRAEKIDSERKRLRIMIKSIKRDHYRSTTNVD